MIKGIKSRLSMKEVRILFWDNVSGEAVRLYTDCYGDEWMANRSGLFSFRCKRK